MLASNTNNTSKDQTEKKENENAITEENKLHMDFETLPENILISTMTITCKLNTLINLENFSKCVDLNPDEIKSIRFGDKRQCSKPDNEGKQTERVKGSFFNQATLEIKPSTNKPINLKLFKNGAVQMTGCKNINNAYEVLDILIKQLKIEKAVMVGNEIIEKKLIEDINKLKITDLKVVMINSNFSVDYLINQEALYKLLISKGVLCTYEPCLHACVNIKFLCDNDEKIISIFVFQSGAIIITGANNTYHIKSAYKFINDFLEKHHNQIEKKKIETLLKNNKILNNLLKSSQFKFKSQ